MALSGNTATVLQIALANPQAANDLVTNVNTPSPSSISTTGPVTATTASANALAVGLNGATGPAFNVDASTASQAAGLNVKGAASGSGVALTAIGGTNELITIDAKGSGTIKLATVAGTGLIQIGSAGISGNGNGITITPTTAGSGLAIAVVSGNAAEALKLDAKGAGVITIGGTSTGLVSLGRGSASTVVESGTKAAVGSGNVTATAAQLLNGYIVGSQSAQTMTTDTAANIDAAIPGVATGDTFMTAYFNSGGGNGTVTGGNNVTVRGTTAIVPTNGVALLFFQRTAATPTYDCLVVGKN